MDLHTLGWNGRLAKESESYAEAGLIPGRICADQRHHYAVLCEAGEYEAEVSGRFRAEAERKGDFPVVGDWVLLDLLPLEAKAIIKVLLPRASSFSRRSAGEKTEEQVVAANIDTAFIVTAADGDFNPRRVERYLALAWNSGAQPVVVINKVDLVNDPEELVGQLRPSSVGAPILAVSAEKATGLEALLDHVGPGRTAVLLGSSGVGKSTIVNGLVGFTRQETRAVRADDNRGRHTTTTRELIVLSTGGAIIDNPGMREVGLWGDEGGLEDAFADIAALASECRFSDCRHEEEPGCAVRRALEESRLDPDRFESYRKLGRELRWIASREDEALRAERKQFWKSIAKRQKSFRKDVR